MFFLELFQPLLPLFDTLMRVKNSEEVADCKEAMRCQTKKTPSRTVILLKKTKAPAALLRMCLLLKIALLSAPRASNPVIIQRGMPVFTIVRRGMSGPNPSPHRTRRVWCPLQKGNQEPGSIKLPGVLTTHAENSNMPIRSGLLTKIDAIPRFGMASLEVSALLLVQK
jgi:hypothetical protein